MKANTINLNRIINDLDNEKIQLQDLTVEETKALTNKFGEDLTRY